MLAIVVGMTKMTSPNTAKCLRCGRTLTSGKSIARGYGRTCGAYIRTAAKVIDLTAYKPFQQAKAVELIEQGGIVPTGRDAQYLAVSSDGTTVYLVDVVEHSCTCPAAAKGLACYHLAAADILTAATPARRAA